MKKANTTICKNCGVEFRLRPYKMKADGNLCRDCYRPNRTPKKYTPEILAPVVASSVSIAEVARKLELNAHGSVHGHLRKRINEFGLDTSHFNPYAGSKTSIWRTAESILILNPAGSYRAKSHHLRRALIEIGRDQKCSECGVGSIWNGKKLVLQVDHINGNSVDDRRENLRFMCPNCHSQTDTFCSKNQNKNLE